MTLEVLFAKAGQSRTFLAMVLLGAGMALLVHLSGRLHLRSTALGMAADLLIAVLLACTVGQLLLAGGEGLRLYALLGLCIGAGLYAAGVAPAANWLLRRCRRKISPTSAGTSPSSAE